MDVLRPDIVIPVLMGCALLWWIGRGLAGRTRLMIAAITLVAIVGILMIERAVR